MFPVEIHLAGQIPASKVSVNWITVMVQAARRLLLGVGETVTKAAQGVTIR